MALVAVAAAVATAAAAVGTAEVVALGSALFGRAAETLVL